MKTLFVLRHGQAAPEAHADADRTRELTERGRREVRRTAEHLLQRGRLPSLILASSAVRARQTAELCRAAWPAGVELQLLDELYLAAPSTYLEALSAAEEHVSVMLVGHNPGLEALVYACTLRSEHLPTAALVEIALPATTWTALSGGARGFGRLEHVFKG